MKPSSDLSVAGKLYVAIVAAAGISAVIHSIAVLAGIQLGLQWFVLAGLTLLSGSFTVRIPTIPARLSVSETFVFAAAMLYGPAAATVLVVLDSLVISLWQPITSRRGLRVLFNTAAPAIAVWVASHAFFFLSATPPLHYAPRPVLSLLVPLIAMAVVYFLLNSWLIAAAVAFEQRAAVLTVWRKNFLWLSLNFFSGASVAALLLPYLQDPDQSFFRVAGILLPLLLISYLTFKTALGRVDDANRHLNELNQLYLSTIETLAMAIDAKDQITHGHIRRVQQYAVGLARLMGITDAAQISAIEAASLLHDMGKLAVPEYILNKPGKLTPAEFDRMKMHASVGADILSSIKFPYPVVPIVRHHHENWDGTGYPDSLKGSAIPVGARILSVVDCFDALTSDRPYRPRLTDTEAIKILLQRRGTMYDPVVVDTFVSSHAELVRAYAIDEPNAAERLARGRLAEVALTSTAPLENIAASSEEMLFVYDLARAMTGIKSDEVIQVAFAHLRRIIPISACVYYEYHLGNDALTAVYVAGDNANAFNGVSMARGQRLSGWVAANKQTILNSDPVLDLGEVARRSKPRLRSCLSTPVLSSETLLGVLTAYSVHEAPFGEDHRRIFESTSRQIADIFKVLSTSETVSIASVGTPRLTAVDELGLAALADRLGVSTAFSLITVRVHHDATATPGLIDTQVHVVAGIMRRHLPDDELVFRGAPDELIAALPSVDYALAGHIVTQIVKSLTSVESTSDLRSIRSMTVGHAAAPRDGRTIEGLLAAARVPQVTASSEPRRPPSVH